jgi:hypothetical protein
MAVDPRQISSKSAYNCLFYSLNSVFEMAVAAILETCCGPPLVRFLNSACFSYYVYQISSKSGDKWLIYSVALIFKMAAAVIFENGDILPVLRFLDSACFS